MSDEKEKGPRPVPDLLLKAPDPKYLREYYATQDRLELEREAARVAVPRLLLEVPRERWSTLAEHADLATAGGLHSLGDMVTEVLTRDAVHAHAIAELAVAVAVALPRDTYPKALVAQLRAHAWKDAGKTLRYLGKHQDSLRALTTAEAVLTPFSGLPHDLALVRFHLASTLQECGRYLESLPILAECKEVFRGCGDMNLLGLCAIAEGLLLQRLGRYREAREKHLLLLASTPDLQTDSLASLHHAIGVCSTELGDFVEAEASLSYAVKMYRELEESIHVIKAELGLGRLFVRRGELNLAHGHLRRVRRDFLHHSLAEEAGLCGLDIVETLLLLDRTHEAEILARTIVHEFTEAALSTRAITALGYLTETIAGRRATAKMVSEVREYVVSLRTTPEREFRHSE
jgi:tetratricopeptide (TPR) repeat protein